MISILINGICGHMGRNVYAACNASKDAFLAVCGVDAAEPDGTLACPVYHDFEKVSEKIDVIVDFSVPAAALKALDFALLHGLPIVIATTGLGEAEQKRLDEAAKHIPVFQTGNLSLGVNLQRTLAKEAASVLGDGFDAEIIETHHNRKVDAPSGTALMLADSVASAYEEEAQHAYVFGRHETNKRRTKGEIGIHSVRGGTVVGEHTVEFLGQDEVIEITHRAFSRQIFAVGALRAAAFLATAPCGRYDMSDVLEKANAGAQVSLFEHRAAVTVTGLMPGAHGAARLLALFAESGIAPDLVQLPAEPGGVLELALPDEVLPAALRALEAFKTTAPDMAFTVCRDQSVVMLKTGAAPAASALSNVLSALDEAAIALRLFAASADVISFCADADSAIKAAALLHKLL